MEMVGSLEGLLQTTEHHRIKEEARQTHSMEVHEDVYHKSVLCIVCNHHMKHAKFKHKCNWLYNSFVNHPVWYSLVPSPPPCKTATS